MWVCGGWLWWLGSVCGAVLTFLGAVAPEKGVGVLSDC